MEVHAHIFGLPMVQKQKHTTGGIPRLSRNFVFYCYRSRRCMRVKLLLPTEQKQKHTTGGIPRWSPTLVLVARFSAYVWQSGRDAQFSLTYGRMYQLRSCHYI
jgi:hypothetical protein